MVAPPSVDFIPQNERIMQLYQKMPAIFAKDIARRQATQSNVGLKRSASEAASQDHTPKRQNTGDTTVSMPTPTSAMSPGGGLPGHQSGSVPPQSPHPHQSQGSTPRPALSCGGRAPTSALAAPGSNLPRGHHHWRLPSSFLFCHVDAAIGAFSLPPFVRPGP